MSGYTVFLLGINLIWLGSFIAVWNNYGPHNPSVDMFCGMWTCGMIGFFLGCVYKQQRLDDEAAEERRRAWPNIQP